MSEAASFLRSSMIHGCPLRPHGVFSVKLNNGSSVWITQVRLNFLELSKILSKSTMVWSHHKLIHSLHHRNKGQKEIYPFVFWHISELISTTSQMIWSHSMHIDFTAATRFERQVRILRDCSRDLWENMRFEPR
jgi:hypothetical protein